jgi:hypothetical protein
MYREQNMSAVEWTQMKIRDAFSRLSVRKGRIKKRPDPEALDKAVEAIRMSDH